MNATQIHINDYVMLLLSDRVFRKNEYRKFVDNCYTLQNIEGDIDPGVLNAIILKAKWNAKLRSMLTGILWYVNKGSITNENFNLLMHFPRRKRNTYLGTISHAELAFYQMQIINSVSGSFEAFAWLFDRICENEFFTEDDMLQLLKDSSDITICGIRSCIDFAREKYGTSSKLVVADNWIKNVHR